MGKTYLLQYKQSKTIATRRYLQTLQQANTMSISSLLVIKLCRFVFSTTLFSLSCQRFLSVLNRFLNLLLAFARLNFSGCTTLMSLTPVLVLYVQLSLFLLLSIPKNYQHPKIYSHSRGFCSTSLSIASLLPGAGWSLYCQEAAGGIQLKTLCWLTMPLARPKRAPRSDDRMNST